VAYSVARELDQKDEESVATAVPGYNLTWSKTLSLAIFRTDGVGSTRLFTFLKWTIIWAEVLPSKKIIIIMVF
jgi:hypothetical protein